MLQSDQFSRSVVSNSLRPHESQHSRPPCLSPTPRVYPNSCPSSWCCHPTISSSVFPFSSCPRSFPESGSFQMSQLFTSGGQSIGVSASTSVLPMNIQDWFPLGWTGWISLQSKGPSRVLSNTTVQKAVLNGLLYCSKLFWTPLVQVEKPHLWKQKSSHRLRVSHSTQDGQCASKSIYLGLKSFQTLSPSLLLPGYLFHSFPSSCHSLAFFPSLIIMMENIVMRGLRFVSY